MANGSSAKRQAAKKDAPASVEVIGMEADKPVRVNPVGRDTVTLPTPPVAARPVTAIDSLNTRTPLEAVA